MPSAQNQEALEALKTKFQRSSVVITTDFTGLDVATLTQLRRKLKEQGNEFLVVKNTLARIAATAVGKGALEKTLQGPSGLVVGYGDAVQCARLLDDYLRTTRIALKIRGGVMEGQAIDAEGVRQLATLLPKPELMARLAGQLLVGVTRLAGALQAPAQALATVLHQSSEKWNVNGVAKPS